MRFFIAAILFFLLSGCANVTRVDLQIAEDANERCVRTEVLNISKLHPPPNFFDIDEISNIYLPYAIASLNAYEYKSKDGKIYEATGEYSNFTLAQFDNTWKKQGRIERSSGLALDYYFNDSHPEKFQILIAFRGTDFDSPSDWYSNFSWLTQFLPIKNQYDHAREVVQEIRSKTPKTEKKLTYLTTGHSLGGALAEHTANAFPCTSAIVFDSSFIVNKHRLAEPYPDVQVAHIFDKDDEATFLRRLLFSDEETPNYRRFRLNAVAKGTMQHSSERLIVGMARTVAECQATHGSTGCPRSDQRAKRLYCGSRYAAREQNEALCRQAP